MLITGEAGIGKTRLVSELAARARSTGATVLVGRCIDLLGTALPYLPVAEALRPLGDAPGALRDVPRRPPATESEEGSQLRLFEEVLTALERAAAEAPVVLVLDDLHWADSSTLDLIAFLEHAVAETRIVVVGTYRSDEQRPHHKLRADAELIELGPLARDELETFLETAAGEHLPADLTSAIHARSEGNPFFAQELLAAAARGDAQLPHVVRDALLRRVARLDPTARAVLRTAAAAGHDVTYGLVAAATALETDRLLNALRAAVDEEILIADQAASSFRFRHTLLAEAVYATLLPGEREDVHARLAKALAADPALAGTGSSRRRAGTPLDRGGPVAGSARGVGRRGAGRGGGVGSRGGAAPPRARSRPLGAGARTLPRSPACYSTRYWRARPSSPTSRATRPAQHSSRAGDRGDRRCRCNPRRAAPRATRLVPPRPGPA